jgi:DnaJ-class molecular chaperone
METETSYFIYKTIDGGGMELLEVCHHRWLEGDFHYYTNMGYDCIIHKMDFCKNCKGSGKVPKTRGKKKLLYEYKTCPDCKGIKSKSPEVDITEEYLAYLGKNK